MRAVSRLEDVTLVLSSVVMYLFVESLPIVAVRLSVIALRSCIRNNSVDVVSRTT